MRSYYTTSYYIIWRHSINPVAKTSAVHFVCLIILWNYFWQKINFYINKNAKYCAASISSKTCCFLVPTEHDYSWTSLCVFVMFEQSRKFYRSISSAETSWKHLLLYFCCTTCVPTLLGSRSRLVSKPSFVFREKVKAWNRNWNRY